jgi:DDE superfamily endonuclease
MKARRILLARIIDDIDSRRRRRYRQVVLQLIYNRSILPRRIHRVLLYSSSEFQLDNYTDDWCIEYLRFSGAEIREILPYLHLDLVLWRNRYNPSLEAAFCLLLYKLSWPHRLKDSLDLFGQSRAWQSSVYNDTLMYLVRRYCDMLYWDRQRLKLETIWNYCSIIEEKTRIKSVWGFIDRTICPICRPSTLNQRLWYTGYKKLYRFKFQAISTPNSLISSLSSPTTAVNGDWAMWHESRLEDILYKVFDGIEEDKEPLIYSNLAYRGGYRIMCAYVRQLGRQLIESKQNFNTTMSSVRMLIKLFFFFFFGCPLNL